MKKAYKFGIELEMLVPRGSLDSFDKGCRALGLIVKSDGSIHEQDGYRGIEINTTPLGFNSMTRLVGHIDKLCDESGAIVNDSCGFHLHTSNKRFFIAKYLKRIVLTWVAIEDVLLSTQPNSRFNGRGAHYSKRNLPDYLFNGYSKKYPAKRSDLIDSVSGGDRYFSLNLRSLAVHSTLEVRLHSGTTNAKKIVNWMTLVRSIFDYALLRYDSAEVEKLFDTLSGEVKNKRVLKLLQLDKKTQEYFIKRCNKFLLPQLAEQQKKAIEAKKIIPEYEAKKRQYERTLRAYREAEGKRDEILQSFQTDS